MGAYSSNALTSASAKILALPSGQRRMGAFISELLLKVLRMVPSGQGFVLGLSGYSATRHSNSLIVISIPEGVTSIGWGAFKDCSSLTDITLPEGVTSIGDYAFSRCSTLTAIILPASVTSIGGSAFFGSHSLTTITIPEGVTSIGCAVFFGCTNLTSIVVAEENKIYDSRGGCNAIIETNTNTLIQGCSATIIPESVTSIGRSGFEGCIGLTAITIPESVTSIGECAFANCSSLTTINIPKSVTSIGYCAFSGCTSLTGILIPKGVTSIGKEALKNSGITYLTILGKPTIDEEAFDGCGQLTDIYCYSEEVPTAKDNAYSGLDLSRITLHVPESALEAYKNTEPWSRFGAIEAIK